MPKTNKTNDPNILAEAAFKQIINIGKVVAKTSPFDYQIKSQTNAISVVYLFFQDREIGRRMVEMALKKKGTNSKTGKGYSVTKRLFPGSNFHGLEYSLIYTDGTTHKIRLRFKALSAGKVSKGSKSGEKKENKGIIFEHELSADFKNYAKYGDAKHKSIKYKTFLEKFTNETEIEKRGLYKVVDMGALNQKRPLIFSGGNIYVGSRDPNIGNKVTDLTLMIGNEKKNDPMYLSLKFGATVTFMNSGISKILPQTEIVKRKLSNENGKALLDLFGVDHSMFMDIFIAASKSKKKFLKTEKIDKNMVDVTRKINKNRLHTFLKTAVGYGFYLIHAHDIGPDGDVSYLEMSQEQVPSYTRPRKVVVVYPVSGSIKRIDVLIDTPKFDLKMNIRNKSGGVFPTHIMLDYKMKH